VHAQILADALGTRIPVLLGVEESVPRGLTPDALGALAGHLEQLETLERSLEMARASEERWMNLAEAVVEGIVLHDGRKILDVNPRFAEMFGYDRREVLGRPIFEFIADDSMPQVVQHIATGSSEPYELLGITRDGERIRVRVQGRSLKNGQRVAAFEVVR
jgi:PAS domain S-box-containing protein